MTPPKLFSQDTIKQLVWKFVFDFFFVENHIFETEKDTKPEAFSERSRPTCCWLVLVQYVGEKLTSVPFKNVEEST